MSKNELISAYDCVAGVGWISFAPSTACLCHLRYLRSPNHSDTNFNENSILSVVGGHNGVYHAVDGAKLIHPTRAVRPSHKTVCYDALVAWCAICYIKRMIKSFKHKGLQKFYETGSVAGIQNAHKKRLRMQLAAVDSSQSINDMDIPGFRLHQLSGRLQDVRSIRVSGNWRITFKFEDGNAHVVYYEDYH